jgi:hypothetical protein
MNDLETRLRDEMSTRASETSQWSTPGAALRAVATQRRAKRLRATAVAASVLAVVAIAAGGVVARQAANNSDPDPARGTPTNAPTKTGGLQQVELTPQMLAAAVSATSGDSFDTLHVALRSPWTHDTVVVLNRGLPEPGGLRLATASISRDGTVRRGTEAIHRWGSPTDVIAQPVPDGDGAALVVLVPRVFDNDTVEVTTSEPGKEPEITTVPLRAGAAVVPITRPDTVTRLRILRDGTELYDDVPAAWYLADDVPRDLDRIAVSSGLGASQSAQVRTDGTRACRFTVGGFWPNGGKAVPWDPFDEACARIDGSLQLLLADDRAYSTVAGVAPPGTGFVRLHWRNGDVTDLPVAADEVPAFIDTSGHRPDQLTLAQAINTSGDETARVLRH